MSEPQMKHSLQLHILLQRKQNGCDVIRRTPGAFQPVSNLCSDIHRHALKLHFELCI